jgi:Arc/MetJ family transcription regulator
MVRTTLEVDEKLLADVVKLTGEKNKGKAVNKALQEYIRRQRIEELRAMLGTIDLVDNWYELRHMEPR